MMTFNGVNGETGEFLLPVLTPAQIAKIVRGETFDPAHLQELRYRRNNEGAEVRGVREGIDATRLSEAGWGVIFAGTDGEEVEKRIHALKPLLDRRKEQAGDLYRQYVGADAYQPGETKSKFLARNGMGPGQADPSKFPYYVLIVADPETIPYKFQYQLDVTYAVGRLHFDTLEDYARYALSVVAAEKGETERRRSVAMFGVKNHADQATRLSTNELVAPLADAIATRKSEWSVSKYIEDNAHKSDLTELLSGADQPALVFTASHGLGFPRDHPLQLKHQGALLCQDWPGPLRGAGRPISPDHYFSVDDLGDVRVTGLVAFHFACYGAGTPRLDDFPNLALREQSDIAPRSFVARLPQAMLSHPKGGALAVLGHVERAWGYSFTWPGAGAQRGVFEDTVARLMDGHPVGYAMEYFNQKYAELSVLLSDELQEMKFGNVPDDEELAGIWTANNDARSYVIVGDPAIRLNVSGG